MSGKVIRPESSGEFFTPERCHILESWNDPSDWAVSIARARVEPGVVTQLHRLRDVEERYLIVQGTGTVNVGELGAITVMAGDIVVIKSGVAQQITNTGNEDLIFYCICSPRFSPECYESLE